MPFPWATFPAAVAQEQTKHVYGELSSNQPAPSSFSDPLYIIFPDYSNEIFFQVDAWSAGNGTALPQQGTPCLVTQDSRGDWVCTWWKGVYVDPDLEVHGVPADAVTTKGDLLVSNATPALKRLPIGGAPDGEVLTLDSTQALGMKWSGAAAGAGYGRVTADIAGTGSMVDVPGMNFPVVAGGISSFSMYLFMSASSGGGNFTFQLTGPASPVSLLAVSVNITFSGLGSATTFSSALSVAVGTVGSNIPTALLLFGTLVNGANAGTVQLQQQSVAITQTVKAGSYLLSTKGS